MVVRAERSLFEEDLGGGEDLEGGDSVFYEEPVCSFRDGELCREILWLD